MGPKLKAHFRLWAEEDNKQTFIEQTKSNYFLNININQTGHSNIYKRP